MPWMNLDAPDKLSCEQKKEWFEEKLYQELPKWEVEYQKLLYPDDYEKRLAEIKNALTNGIAVNEREMLLGMPSCQALPVGNNPVL